MKKFNVINFNFNSKKFVQYDVIPFLVSCYDNKFYKHNPKPETLEDWINFVRTWSRYQWWSRCEYEIILSEWPPCNDPTKNHKEKWDVYNQIEMNIEIIADIVKKEIEKKNKSIPKNT